MTASDPCPTCGKSRGGMLETHRDQPGIVGLLRGEGEDGLLIAVAWLALLLAVFAVAWGGFALIAATH